jgi:hypothetical protein
MRLVDNYATTPEETRRGADMIIEAIKLRTLINKEIDKTNRQWDMVSHTGPDGLRHLNKELTFFEVYKYAGLMLFNYLEKNHPTALTRLKVALVAIPFFFVLAPAANFLAFPL